MKFHLTKYFLLNEDYLKENLMKFAQWSYTSLKRMHKKLIPIT